MGCKTPRSWYEQLKLSLLEIGFFNSVTNSGLFVFKKEVFVVYVLIYVNDILLIGLNSEIFNP